MITLLYKQQEGRLSRDSFCPDDFLRIMIGKWYIGEQRLGRALDPHASSALLSKLTE